MADTDVTMNDKSPEDSETYQGDIAVGLNIHKEKSPEPNADKQSDVVQLILSLRQRSQDQDFTGRPKYSEVCDIIESLRKLENKPAGFLNLEKEQKRHQEWLYKGMQLFGIGNQPLHLLKPHLEKVLERNLNCFDVNSDKPKQSAELARSSLDHRGDLHFREVFCICRRVENDMMVQCELCHEWYICSTLRLLQLTNKNRYHAKCLKIPQEYIKEAVKYTCPICDWRIEIPREVARPKLEDLQSWQDEISSLPFQQDEEDVLQEIIKNAQQFANYVSSLYNPSIINTNVAETQRFYLRKLEGAGILLVSEIDFFRTELQKRSGVAPEPPQVI